MTQDVDVSGGRYIPKWLIFWIGPFFWIGPSTFATNRLRVVLRIEAEIASEVARAGIEPATFRFSGGRSYQLSYLAGRSGTKPKPFGDPDGTRTRDLRRDRAAR